MAAWQAMTTSKILWFLWANPTFTASARLQGLAIHNQLKRLGYASGIAYIPTSFERTIPFSQAIEQSLNSLLTPGDIVVLQKCKDEVNLRAIRFFKNSGLKVILIDCDLPIAEEIGNAVDCVICSSKLLSNAYSKLNVQSVFIEDAPERFEQRTLFTDKKKFTCVWFGDGTDYRWNDVEKLKTILKDSRLSNWELITISNHAHATIQWQPDYLTTISQRADVIALPVFTDNASSYKSANRLLQSMALSLPTLCSPIQSYQAIADKSKGVLVCSTEEEWVNAFLLLENAVVRKQLSQEAFHNAQKYRLEERITEWVEVLQLNEQFKTTRAVEKILKFISNLFYTELIKKNIKYFNRVPLSFASTKNALHYFFKNLNT
jgi:hypothetical protein